MCSAQFRRTSVPMPVMAMPVMTMTVTTEVEAEGGSVGIRPVVVRPAVVVAVVSPHPAAVTVTAVPPAAANPRRFFNAAVLSGDLRVAQISDGCSLGGRPREPQRNRAGRTDEPRLELHHVYSVLLWAAAPLCCAHGGWIFASTGDRTPNAGVSGKVPARRCARTRRRLLRRRPVVRAAQRSKFRFAARYVDRGCEDD